MVLEVPERSAVTQNGRNIDGANWGYTNGEAASKTRLFANALAEAGLTEVANAEFVTGNEQITVDLEPGVYLFTNTRVDEIGKVSATVPMLLASGTLDKDNKVLISVEGGNIKVEMKNSVNTPQTKEVTEKSASIGDTLHYTLKGQVTSTVADTFSFEDTPGVGLTVNLPTDAANLNGFSVAVYDVDENGDPTGEPTPLTYDADYTITNNLREGNMGGEVSEGVMGTFTVTVKDAYRYAGEMIVVEYTALVNDEASVEDGVVNTLDNYGNSMQTETKTKMYSFDFTKKNVDGEALPEAQLEITKGEETLYFVKQDDGSYKKAVSKETPDATSTLEVIKEGADKGKLVVTGLGEGNYTVHETKAPTGYQLPTNLTFTVTIAADGAVTIVQDAFKLASQDSQTKAITVTNVRNITQLPLTGAAGTMLFTVLGLLIAGAGALVYMKSRSVKHALRG